MRILGRPALHLEPPSPDLPRWACASVKPGFTDALRLAASPLCGGPALLSSLSDAQEQQQDEEEEEEDMVEVGYVSGLHGVRGDVLIAPRTDFPELRFATPGKRWLRARAAGKHQVNEFELVRGRAHTGKKSWIVSFDGINNVDEVVIRARNLRTSAQFIPAKAFKARKSYYTNEENGLLHVPKEEAQKAQAAMFSDPNMAMDMMKKNLSMIVPQTLTFAWVNFFFSGFVQNQESNHLASATRLDKLAEKIKMSRLGRAPPVGCLWACPEGSTCVLRSSAAAV